jgi:hypothetical protein
MAGPHPTDDFKQLHDALLRACEDYDADEAIRGLGSAAVAIIGSKLTPPGTSTTPRRKASPRPSRPSGRSSRPAT